MNKHINIAFQFLFLVLIQILLLNQVQLFGYINPIIYIVFIFLFPLSREKSTLLILSFFLGLIIDFFTNSGGSNAAATVLIAYIRLPLLQLIINKKDIDFVLFHIKKLYFYQRLIFILSLVLIHHSFLFLLEYYKSSNVIEIFTIIFSTTLFSTILIVFSIELFSKTSKQ